MAVEPPSAIGTIFVDDDADLADPRGAKSIQRMGDERPTADRDQRFARPPAIGAQAAAFARGNDAAASDGMRPFAGYVRISANSQRRITTG